MLYGSIKAEYNCFIKVKSKFKYSILRITYCFEILGNFKNRHIENKCLTNPIIYLVSDRQFIFLMITLLNVVFNCIHFGLREDTVCGKFKKKISSNSQKALGSTFGRIVQINDWLRSNREVCFIMLMLLYLTKFRALSGLQNSLQHIITIESVYFTYQFFYPCFHATFEFFNFNILIKNYNASVLISFSPKKVECICKR